MSAGNPTVTGPLVSKTGDKLDIVNQPYLTQWNTMYTAVIIGQKSIKDFDTFIEEWKKQVGNEMVDLANTTYVKK